MLAGRMRTKTVAIVPVALMSALVIGCGSGTPDKKLTPKAATVPADLSASLNARLDAQDGRFASSAGAAQIQTAAEVRAQSDGQEPSADRLDAAGTQPLTGADGNAGVRVVFHFPSDATALADFKAVTSRGGGPAHTYKIPGVPNSLAADETGPGNSGDRNVTFVAGAYEYRLGFSLDKGRVPTRAQFIAMTKAWYRKLEDLG